MKKRVYVAGLILGTVIWGGAMSVMADSADAAKESSLKPAQENEEEECFPEGKLIKNEKGEIVGVDTRGVSVEESPAIEYEFVDTQELMKTEQFKEYEKLGLIFEEESQKLYFYGLEIGELSDYYQDNTILQYTSEDVEDPDNAVFVYVVRDEHDNLKYFEISEYMAWTDDWGDYWDDGEYATEESGMSTDFTAEAIIGEADAPTSIFLD